MRLMHLGYSILALLIVGVADDPAGRSAFAGTSPSATKSEPKVAGTVVATQGTSLIRSEASGNTASARPVRVGDKVHEGDVINTPSNGQVKLMLLDKTIMDIGKSALFKVQKFEANSGLDRVADVSMMYGSIRAVVTQPIKGKGSFKVRTASSTMGVRGTEFVVKAEMGDMKSMANGIKNPGSAPAPAAEKGAPAAKTEVTVVQGKVDVEPPKPPKSNSRSPASAKPQVVSLGAGSQLTTSTADAAPAKPVALSSAQLAEVKSAVKVEDNTFKKAIVLDLSGNSSSSGSSGNSSGGYGGGSGGGGPGGGPGGGGAMGGDMGGGGVGNITASIISETVAAPPASVAAPVSAANAGFAGTINAGNILSGPPAVNLTAGGLRRIKIILVR